ncbi:SigB/SigF/SigG family RNA polymerase sigma factor [Nonomuraea zeae]|uniref:SigB/SigF/SigG family RNA polymerase sigma factor n=1 Tax=Nonomuraea zeae TaxID=1642303 RepID=A0A5S4H0Q8_9ACTN|nr:SigB/SigF/SigG family RNA polymerase sigma factor [Nonomuraea zeae]TMR38281.1 SigB/SigF/SigG family RNA polymerase sigma factor [Nonomuraea zeae]
MTDHNTALTDMTAEQLLVAMVAPGVSEERRARLRERLVETHHRLVTEIVRRYRYRGEPMEDLRQAAYVGLVKAINGFDPGLGHEFRGYAAVTIAGEIKRHFRDRTWAIRVPRVYQERRSELNRVSGELAQSLGRSPTVAELAARMDLSEEEALLTLEASSAYSTLSLDAPVGTEEGDSACLGDFIPAYDDSLDTFIDAQAVRPLIDALPERERHILLLRFHGNLTQSEIAAEFGISQMHVSRLLRTTLALLRQSLVGATDRRPTRRTRVAA